MGRRAAGAASREGLALKVDGKSRASQNAYVADGGLVVWMGNEDLELIRGPGEGRRRYLDFLGAQLDPAYRRSWSRYRRALQAKNLLLKEGRTRDAEILSYEEILIEHGSVLMEVRARLVADLAPLAAAAQRAVSGRDEPLTLHYLPASGPDLRESMLQARERETRLRQAVVGPHRDDSDLRLHGMPAADFASEGQQRTIALALKLAQGALLERRGGKLPGLPDGRHLRRTRPRPPQRADGPPAAARAEMDHHHPSRLVGGSTAARRNRAFPRQRGIGDGLPKHLNHLTMNDDLLPDLIAAVEQQLTSPQTPYVAKTLARLVKLGIPESEAKSQIALCLGEEMDQVLRKRRGFDEKSYRASLENLPMADDNGES